MKQLTRVRQIGPVLAIAILVAVLEAATPGDPVAGFTDAYTLMALAGGLTAALALVLGRVRAAASAPGAAAEAAA